MAIEPTKLPRLCGAKNRRGSPCTQHAIRGKARCRFHGGKSTGAKKPHRDPGNQNALKTALYATVIDDDEARAVYESDQAAEPTLEHERRLARAQLFRYLRKHGLNVEDGLKIRDSHGGEAISESWVPHVRIVLEHLDKIRRLELAQHALGATGDAGRGSLEKLMDALQSGAHEGDA